MSYKPSLPLMHMGWHNIRIHDSTRSASKFLLQESAFDYSSEISCIALMSISDGEKSILNAAGLSWIDHDAEAVERQSYPCIPPCNNLNYVLFE
jgi:hypothetical protein